MNIFELTEITGSTVSLEYSGQTHEWSIETNLAVVDNGEVVPVPRCTGRTPQLVAGKLAKELRNKTVVDEGEMAGARRIKVPGTLVGFDRPFGNEETRANPYDVTGFEQ